VGKYWFGVESINDRLYGLTVFNSNKVSVIYDAVKVVLNATHNRVTVGDKANVDIDAYYLYDHEKYDGVITLNDTLVKNDVGLYWYGVASAGNDSYGIDVVFYKPIYIIFDKPVIEISSNSLTPYTLTIFARIYSAYDNKLYKNAEITINGVKAEYIDGTYQATLRTIIPYQGVHIEVSVGAVRGEADTSIYCIGNLILLIALIGVIAFIIKKLLH
jgi:hypothetical protein